jgi:RHS repeat-associated protein
VGDRTFSFDTQNRLTSGDGATYSYTSRGTLSSVTREGNANASTFDAFDRLTAMGAAKYTYDSLDRVAARNGTSFQYLGMTNEAVADGSRTISRLPDGTAFADKGSGAARMLFADSHGDVVGRYLSNTVDGQRSFDPFGAVTSSSGDTASVGYQGDWTDPETGAVNMTARWYQPGTGTFASRDDWTLDPSPSAAANRYAYGNASPLSGTDPSGHDWISAVCELDFSGKNRKSGWRTVGRWAGRILRAGTIAGAVAGNMICDGGTAHAPGGRGGYCPRCKVEPRDVEQPIPRGYNCKYFIGGCDARRDYRPPTPPPNCRQKSCAGPGTKKPRVVRPSPPPPPRWWTDIHKPVRKPPPGSTVIGPPTSYDPTSPLTVITDLTNVLIDAATAVTETAVDVANLVGTPFDDLVGDAFSVQLEEQATREPDEEGCLDGDSDVAINEAFNDEMETIKDWKGPFPGKRRGQSAKRATAGTVCLTETNGPDRGYVQTPVGYKKGQHHRSHLVGHNFFGSGKRNNVVPLDGEVNTPDMLGVENQIAAVVDSGQRVYYRVEAVYARQEDAVPVAIDIYAVGAGDFRCKVRIHNPHPAGGYPNGKNNGNRPSC